jgi:outer membrane lipoprotein-sorting protein
LGTEDGRNRAWVDPERDYVVVRWELIRPDGTVILRTRLQYAEDDDHGWVPSGWELSMLDAEGNAGETYEATIRDYEIGLELTRDDFRIRFPIGTTVYDDRTKEFYVVQPENEATR